MERVWLPMTGKPSVIQSDCFFLCGDLKHLTEVVEEVARGTLWVGDYRCPECDEDQFCCTDADSVKHDPRQKSAPVGLWAQIP